MREGGFEPPRPFGHRILSPARLPVPALSRCNRAGQSVCRARTSRRAQVRRSHPMRGGIALPDPLVGGLTRGVSVDKEGTTISHKVLTHTLRRAERDGLISRHLDAERVETATPYQLADLGRSLDQPPLAEFASWTVAHGHEVEAAHRHWDVRSTSSCGQGRVVTRQRGLNTRGRYVRSRGHRVRSAVNRARGSGRAPAPGTEWPERVCRAARSPFPSGVMGHESSSKG